MARARAVFSHCQWRQSGLNISQAGVVKQVVVATYSDGKKNTTGSFPGDQGGCMIHMSACANKRHPTGWFYDDDARMGTPFSEAACMRRARDFYRGCGNTKEPPAKAWFAKTKKTGHFPGDLGGCMITDDSNCGDDAKFHGTLYVITNVL